MAKLTEAVFSMQCSFIAKNARFTDEMRARLDRLDQWAGRTTEDSK